MVITVDLLHRCKMVGWMVSEEFDGETEQTPAVLDKIVSLVLDGLKWFFIIRNLSKRLIPRWPADWAGISLPVKTNFPHSGTVEQSHFCWMSTYRYLRTWQWTSQLSVWPPHECWNNREKLLTGFRSWILPLKNSVFSVLDRAQLSNRNIGQI